MVTRGGSGTVWRVAQVSYSLAITYHDIFGQWEFHSGEKK